MQRFLCLYSDHDGLQRAAIFEAPNDFDNCDPDVIQMSIIDQLQSYNDGGGLFIVELPKLDDLAALAAFEREWRPDITDEQGDEVPVQFVTIHDDDAGGAM